MSNAIENILVNGKTYKVQKLDVLSTIYMHVDFMHILGPALTQAIAVLADLQKGKDINPEDIGYALAKLDPDVVKGLQIKVFAQVITPDNRFLNDPVTIEDWFSRPENSSDVWEVFVWGLKVLLGEHLPSFMKKIAPEKTTATE